MPNFDLFERLIRDAMTGMAEGHLAVTDRMVAISNSERPTLFRDLDHAALSDWVFRARRFLRLEYGADVDFVTSRDNRWGADLQVIQTGTMIELKSGGPVTDANPGLSSVAWALEDSSNALRSIMSDSMKHRRQLYLDGDMIGLLQSKRETMERLMGYFRRYVNVGRVAPLRLQHYVRCVAMGITTKRDIKNLEGRNDLLDNAPQILHADLDHGWRPEEHSFHQGESIVVDRLDLSDPSSQSGVPRLTLILRGSLSGRMAKLYPHYKNSYKLANGIKIPAKWWVRTACFHVWIGTD